MKVGHGQYECGDKDLLTELHSGYNPKNIYTLMFRFPTPEEMNEKRRRAQGNIVFKCTSPVCHSRNTHNLSSHSRYFENVHNFISKME
jgi:hypothetical protein